MDLARILKFNRMEAIYQSDVVILEGKVVKDRGINRVPKLYSVEKIELIDNKVVTTIKQIERNIFFDGKDHIRG